ncbi:MAG: tRNA pseudouridine(65) synthase TruC [Idiomarina sp.]|nr:tRNA pseudouridine(65) synthase TruC [Idiomarina sp.]
MSFSPLDILYQDEYLVAINKPSGLLVHRTALARGERFFAMQLLRDQIGCHVYPVHRLDRPTSGILIFALSSAMARRLSDGFAERAVQKTYHAVVRGYLPDEGCVDYPLKEELDDIADALADQDKEAQSAVTDFVTLERVELPFAVSKKHATSRFSLVELSPKTGRKHQIRRHMAHLRHPIIGDTNHGDGRQNKFFREQFDSHRLLLAATGMEFAHPVTGERVSLSCPMPEEFRRPFDWSPDLLET